MSVKAVLLEVLEDLTMSEFEKFMFFLNDHDTLNEQEEEEGEEAVLLKPIPKFQLEGARRTGVVEVIFQAYNHQVIEVVKKLLRKIPRNDLVDTLHKKVSRRDEVGKLHKKVPRGDEVEELHKKVPRRDEVEELHEKVPRRDEVEELHKKVPRRDEVEELHEKVPRRDEVEELHEKVPRRDEVEELHKKVPRRDEVEELHKKVPRRHEVEELHEKVSRRDVVEELHEKVSRRDEVEELHEKVPRRDEVEELHEKVPRRDEVEELHEKVSRRDEVEERHEKVSRRDEVEELHEKVPRRDEVEELHKKVPRRDEVEELHEKVPRRDEVEELHDKVSRRDEVEELHKKVSRRDEVEDQQHQHWQQQSTSRTVAPGLNVSEQKEKSTSVEVSSEVKAWTGALSVCGPDEKSSPEEVLMSPPVVKASSYSLNTNTSSKYDHITSKDLIQSGPPAVYQLIPKKQNIGKDIRKMSLGRRDPNRTNRTILLVGETGAGKSTLINALVNYDMGVEWDDNVWFEIIETEEKRRECEKQKPDVIVYEIFGFEGKILPYSLTVIDTPGYGDTRGTEHDKIICQRLFDLFHRNDGVHKIDVVGLVLKASENRLNDRLRYIFDSMVSLFGKDLEENIVALITYSFWRAPKNVLEALQAANIKCAKNDRNHPVHFLFDKCPNTERTKDWQVTWEFMKEGMRKFTDHLKEAEPKKLKTTAEVLNTRIQLTACVQNLQERIQETELKPAEIQDSLEKAQQKMKSNEKFMVEVEDPVTENISGGMWALGLFYNGAVCCKVCKETCHFPCTLAWYPSGCNMMANEHCTVCKGKCPVSNHVKEQWRYVVKPQKVKKPDEEMGRRYLKGKADHENLQKDQKNTKEELQGYKDQLLEEAFQHVLRLEEIALNTDSLSTHVHLDFLMEQMKERRDMEKVQKLEKMKRRVDEGTRAGLRYKLTAAS